jgi:hypothetical protein
VHQFLYRDETCSRDQPWLCALTRKARCRSAKVVFQHVPDGANFRCRQEHRTFLSVNEFHYLTLSCLSGEQSGCLWTIAEEPARIDPVSKVDRMLDEDCFSWLTDWFLLNQIFGSVTSASADSACERGPNYCIIHKYAPVAAIIVPPRSISYEELGLLGCQSS